MIRYAIDRSVEAIITWESFEDTSKVIVTDGSIFYGEFQFVGKLKIVNSKSVAKEYK